MSFDPSYWYWLGWLLVAFLPRELWGALKTPTRPDTFSEFCWFSFGVKPRRDGTMVPLAPLRRMTLVAFMGALTMHLAFAWTVVPVAVFGAGIGAVLIRAVGWERKR